MDNLPDPIQSTNTATAAATVTAATTGSDPNTSLNQIPNENLNQLLVSSTPLATNVSGALGTNNSSAVLGSGRDMGQNLFKVAFTKGLITQELLQKMEAEVVSSTKSMEEILLENGITEETVYKLKSEITGVPFVDLANTEIAADVLSKIPLRDAKQNMAVAYNISVNGIQVAMTDPLDIQKTKFLRVVTGANVIPAYAAPSQIQYILDNKYQAQVSSEVEEALEDVANLGAGVRSVADSVTDLGAGNLASAPVSKIVNMILEYAIRYQASDVHIEPRESKIAVRFRIFGVLSEKLSLPKKLLPAVVSRVKILANLKIDEHRVPQDGRFQVKLRENLIDLRVSIVPAVYGEKIVMRLLKKGGSIMNIEDTGMRGHALKLFASSLEKTQGIVLVTGPTGSGKTQTLASSLQRLNKVDVNIMTLEDPVEIRVDGINQVQVNADVGLTFAKGLRSFLRQDPDIIMVGEIRDSETAELAVQAALTGHLVLATLHTNSAAGAIPRLLDMGIEPFLLSSTLNVILAQRLVRRINPKTIEGYLPDADVREQIMNILDGLSYNPFSLPNNNQGNPQDPNDDRIALYRGVEKGNEPAYTSRIGIFEALEVNEQIGKLILQHASINDIKKAAVANGMVTMLQDGIIKALEGVTTLEEVLRVQSL